jgi:hypothetical protein
MPLQSGSSQKTIGNNIRELHTGKTYAHTSSKFGKKDADKQAVAIAIDQAKGRAMGGVAPQMPNLGGMTSQAMQSTPPGAGMGGGNNPTMPLMAQSPPNGVAAAGMNPAMMGPQSNLTAGTPGLAGSRGFAQGGVAGVAGGGHHNTFKGPIISAVPGRTDKHKTSVPSGSFVIPADIVSGHGEGNTLAGMKTLQKLFKMGSHAGNPSAIPGVNPTIKKLAQGGSPSDKHVGKPVRVILAGGEIVVPPENVHETMQRICKKSMTLSQCHQAMDQWVLKQRKKLRKTLAGLPGPARD